MFYHKKYILSCVRSPWIRRTVLRLLTSTRRWLGKGVGAKRPEYKSFDQLYERLRLLQLHSIFYSILKRHCYWEIQENKIFTFWKHYTYIQNTFLYKDWRNLFPYNFFLSSNMQFCPNWWRTKVFSLPFRQYTFDNSSDCGSKDFKRYTSRYQFTPKNVHKN